MSVGAPAAARRVLLLAALVIAALAAVQSWERLQGRLAYTQLQTMKATWQAGDGMPHDRVLNRGLALGYRAVAQQPANAAYRLALAGMHAWRAKGLRLWPRQAAAESDKVVENLKAALARRPSWYQAWAMLALVKYQAGERDRQLLTIMEKALASGPYETAVHHALAIVGPRVRRQLGAPLRKRLIEVLRVALHNPHVKRFVVEQIVMTGMENEFANELADDAALARLAAGLLEERQRL